MLGASEQPFRTFSVSKTIFKMKRLHKITFSPRVNITCIWVKECLLGTFWDDCQLLKTLVWFLYFFYWGVLPIRLNNLTEYGWADLDFVRSAEESKEEKARKAHPGGFSRAMSDLLDFI